MKKYFPLMGLLAFAVAGCAEQDLTATQITDATIMVDGSSTVYPITLQAANRFLNTHDASISVNYSGSSAGFRAFCRGETDVSNASRPINDEERAMCQENNIAFLTLPVAMDAMAIVVNPKNTWVDDISMAELKTMWAEQSEGKINEWQQVRAEWPDKPLSLYGRGQNSGTYDYFTTHVTGETRQSRHDYVASECVGVGGTTGFGIFRPPASDNWIVSSDLSTVIGRSHYGSPTDKPITGDFNNDGIPDRAVFRAGEWIIDYNMDGSVNQRNKYGLSTDIPLVGRMNNDGISDRAVFRAGQWIIDYGIDGTVDKRSTYGTTGDVPLIGDFNNDGTPDRAVFRASATNNWIIDYNMDGSEHGTGMARPGISHSSAISMPMVSPTGQCSGKASGSSITTWTGQ